MQSVVSFSQQTHKYFAARPVHKIFAVIVSTSHYPAKESE